MSAFALQATLQPAVTKAASFTGTALDLPRHRVRELIVTLDITVAERDTSNETYDVYITTTDGVSTWDIAHFPQIATTGAKRFTARILADLLPQQVTTAAPGVASAESGTLKTEPSGLNAPLSLGAGIVRHGPIGNAINHQLVVAGTIVTGLSYSISVLVR